MLPKKGKMLHLWVGVSKSPKDYAELIAKALKAEHGDTHRSVKTIMNWTDASERSVKNWLSGESGPSGYFLMRLFVKSVAIRGLVLELAANASTQHSASPVAAQIDFGVDDRPVTEVQTGAVYGDIIGDIYGDMNVTINPPAPTLLNPRQEWFLERVARDEKCTAEDIAGHWDVALRTAKRDIGLLRDGGRVIFSGSRRRGRYVVPAPPR